MRLRRPGLFVLLCWVFALGAVGLAARPAAAHAALEGASPAPDDTLQEAPTDVTLLFDEPVQASLGGIRVFDPDGRRVDHGSAGRRDDGRQITVDVRIANPGTYTVAWSVVSDDGHVISGSYLFAYKQRGATSAGVETGSSGPSAVVSGLGWLGRTLAYLGTLLVIGVLGLMLAVPFARRVGLAETQGMPLSWSAVTVRLLLVGFAASIAGVLFAVTAQTAVAANRGIGGAISLLGDAFTTTRFGRLAMVRIGAAIGALGPAIALRSRVRRGAAHGVRPVLLDAGVALLIMVPAVAGHAWTLSGRFGAVTVDAVHILAVGVWVGGFVALLTLLREHAPATGTTTPGTAAPSTADDGEIRGASTQHGATQHMMPITTQHDLLRRFSGRAGVALVLVVTTGTVSTILNLDSFADLTGSTYGRLILAKFALTTILGIIGLRNRQTIARLAATSVGFVRRSVRAEIFVAVAIVAIAAVLVNRAPTRAVASNPVSITSQIGPDRRVSFTLFPARRGSNDVHLYFFTNEGIIAPVDVVEVRAGVNGLPPRGLDVIPITPSHYQIRGAQLPNRGTWRFDISTAVDDQQATTQLEIPIR